MMRECSFSRVFFLHSPLSWRAVLKKKTVGSIVLEPPGVIVYKYLICRGFDIVPSNITYFIF
jgi:hypothetical protein